MGPGDAMGVAVLSRTHGEPEGAAIDPAMAVVISLLHAGKLSAESQAYLLAGAGWALPACSLRDRCPGTYRASRAGGSMLGL
ncbi:MAG: hypothetical protein M0Z91_03185 [Actinomycetota bacterium]|jgi:hypothetical protein|nr:hypothetical protein [Actinomycetota bacterium]